MAFLRTLKTSANRLSAAHDRLKAYFDGLGNRPNFKRRIASRRPSNALQVETLETRTLLTTAVVDGGWFDPNTWDDGVPTDSTRAIIGQGITVELDGADHVARELVIHGDLVVPEGESDPTEVDKALTTRWIHINSGGEFIVGSESDRYDEGTFTLTLTGTDVDADFNDIETIMNGVPSVAMPVRNNDGFLMTAMDGRVQFFGEDKISFTKLSSTAEAGATEIVVENLIERNFNAGAMNGQEFVTSASDDGVFNWEVGDQIVIASSSRDYTEEDVRTIEGIVDNANGTSSLTLDMPLTYRHYGEVESYGNVADAEPGTTPAAKTYAIDMRAEVALLSRNIKIQGLASQDTDNQFGDRAQLQTEARVRSNGLGPNEPVSPTQVANGVGGHLMFMPTSGQITVDGVQLEGLGQASQKGRYPIHWHLGQDRSGDVLKNSSITNSNNRGVTIHGTENLHIEGVVLHDIHGHGFFFEDAVETGNQLISNIAFGIHQVGGDENVGGRLGVTDPFVVDTHDNVRQANSRFRSSAAFWITNPTNTFVGNISAGASGTGFWYAIPRTALGSSAELKDIDGNLIYKAYNPIYAPFGQFDHNVSHSTPVGLNFDRGTDIEDARPTNSILPNQDADNYSPRLNGESTTNFVHGFTNYKANDAAVYHRGQADSIFFHDVKVADSYNSVWAVSKTKYTDNLYVGHSRNNADYDAQVGGPRLYDGAGLYTNTHFAGFADNDAYAFQVEGSSFGPTMYHAFRGTSFEADGTYGNLSHAVSDFPNRDEIKTEHDLGQPSRWIKGVLDLDGTLTSAAGGGPGFSIVPEVEFLADGDDFQPAGWESWLTDDIYTRLRVTNNDNGVPLFPSQEIGEPLLRFTARDGDVIDAMSGQNIGDLSWSQIAVKTDGDGFVEGTSTVEFMRNGVPTSEFDLHLRNQDGDRPELNPTIQAKVDAARIVVKVVGAGNFTPSNFRGVTEVTSESALRSTTEGIAYWRDDAGNLLLNAGIANGWEPIKLTPGAALQTKFASRRIQYGTTIEAEHFDRGIDGIAYHDTNSVNSLGTFRGDTGVDVSPNHVGEIADGEWLEYTATMDGNAYNVGFHVSSNVSGGQIRVLAAKSNSSGYFRDFGTVDVPDTGGEFTTVWLDGVDLTFADGLEHPAIRLEFVGGGFELDSFEFSPATQTAFVPDRTIAADLKTTRIELEEFDLGGPGVAYFDTSPGNQASDSFRTDEDVDTNDSLLNGQVFNGEWLEYTTDIHAGTYDISLKKIWGGSDNAVKLYVGETNSALELVQLGEFDFLLPGDQQELVTLENIDLSPWAGKDRVIRIEIVGNWMGLDYMDFASKSQSPPTANIVDVTPDPSDSQVGEVTIRFNEDVSGFDTNDLTLLHNGTRVELGDSLLTQVSPREYTLDLTAHAATNGVYELTLNSLDSGIQDAAGNTLANDATEQFTIDVVDSTAPQVTSLVVNDGDAQRSMVSELTVTFSEDVGNIDGNAFVLTNTRLNTQIPLVANTEVINGQTVARLTFLDASLVGGSLPNGNYTLTTLADSIRDAAGNQLDGNQDGNSGDNATDDFFRLFGDVDGDRDVDRRDVLFFRRAFNTDSLDAAFQSAFDADNDGDIDRRDLLFLRRTFNKTLPR